MIQSEMQQQLFEYILTNNNAPIMDYLGENPSHVNCPMNDSEDTLLSLAQEHKNTELVALIQQFLSDITHSQFSYLDLDDESEIEQDNLSDDEKNIPQETPIMMHKAFNYLRNRIAHAATPLELAMPALKNCHSTETLKFGIHRILQKLLDKALEQTQLSFDVQTDYLLAVNSLVNIYNHSPVLDFKPAFQAFFNERDLNIRGTQLDFCFYRGSVNEALEEIVNFLWRSELDNKKDMPYNVYDVLMENSLETLADSSGQVSTYIDPIMAEAISLPSNPRYFVRDVDGYVHRLVYFDNDFDTLRGVFPHALQQVTPNKGSGQAAVRTCASLWFSEDTRLKINKTLPNNLRHWLTATYAAFKNLDDYVRQFEIYDKQNDAKQQFNDLVIGLYAGGKKTGDGTEETAGVESTLAVAKFSEWIMQFQQDFPQRYERLMNVTAYISNGLKAQQHRVEEKNLKEVLFPILHPAEALEKDETLLCSDQNGANLKEFLNDDQVDNLFNSFATDIKQPRLKSTTELQEMTFEAERNINTSAVLGLSKGILPSAYDVSESVFYSLAEASLQDGALCQNEFNQLMAVFNQPGMINVKSNFLQGREDDCWKIVLQVLRAQSIPDFEKNNYNYHQLQSYLMAWHIKNPNASLERSCVLRSYQQAMDEASNESPWMIQLISMSKIVDHHLFQVADRRFPVLQPGTFVVHKSAGRETQYKIVNRVRNISMESSGGGAGTEPSQSVTNFESESTDHLRLRKPYSLPAVETTREDVNGDIIFEYPTTYNDVVTEYVLEPVSEKYRWNEFTKSWRTKCVSECGRETCYDCSHVVSDKEVNGKWYDYSGRLIGQKIPYQKNIFKDDVHLNLFQHWHELEIGEEGKTLRPLQSKILNSASLMDYAIVTENTRLIKQLLEVPGTVNIHQLFDDKGHVMSGYMMQEVIRILAEKKAVSRLTLSQLRQLFSECRRLNQPQLLSKLIELGLPVNDSQVELKVDQTNRVHIFGRRYESILDLAIQCQYRSLLDVCLNSYDVTQGDQAHTIQQLVDLYKKYIEIRLNHAQVISTKIIDGFIKGNGNIAPGHIFQGSSELCHLLLDDIAKRSNTDISRLPENFITALMSQSLNGRRVNGALSFFKKIGTISPYLLNVLTPALLNLSSTSDLLKNICEDNVLRQEVITLLCLPAQNAKALTLVKDKYIIIKLLSAIAELTPPKCETLQDNEIYSLLLWAIKSGNKALLANIDGLFSERFSALPQDLKNNLMSEVLKKGYREQCGLWFQKNARLAQVDATFLSDRTGQETMHYYTTLVANNKERIAPLVLDGLASIAYHLQDTQLLTNLLSCGLSVNHKFSSLFIEQPQLLGFCIAHQKSELLTNVVSRLETISGYNVAVQDEDSFKKMHGSLIQAYLEGVKQGSNGQRQVHPRLLTTSLRNAIRANYVVDITFLLDSGANGKELINELSLRNVQLLPTLLKNNDHACQLFSDKFVMMYDALYRTNAFFNICPFNFFRSAHRWQNKNPSLNEIIDYCKKNPNSRSAQVITAMLENSQALFCDDDLQDKSALFKDLHKLSCNSSFFSKTHTSDTAMQSEQTISDYVKQHQGSRSEVIARAIGIT